MAVFKPALIADAARGAGYEGRRRDKAEGDGVLSTTLAPATFDLIRNRMVVAVAEGFDGDLLNREAGYGLGSEFSFEHRDPDVLNAALLHLLLICLKCKRGRLAAEGAVELHPAIRRGLELIGDGLSEEV